MTAVDVLRMQNAGVTTPMIGRLRSTIQTHGAIAALICTLSLAGLSTSHAAPPTVSGPDDVGGQPCNDVCKAYLAWSDGVSTKLRPSPPAAQTAVHDRKPAGRMTDHRASKPRPPGLNAFAQLPVRRDAAALSARTVQAVVAPPRAADEIAERFPPTAGFVTALLASTAGATNDAQESTVVSVTDAIAATQGTNTIVDSTGALDLRFAILLCL